MTRSVTINTPLSSDAFGAVYFGFQVTGPTPVPLASGIARIGPDGEATWIPVASAADDEAMTKVVHNCAPALSPDSSTLYIAVSGDGVGYLLALDSRMLARFLRRVRLGHPSATTAIDDNASASPTVGPDGDVYLGVVENPFPENHGRGWLLHFDGGLSQSKVPGAFGWDTTPSLVPVSMVPSYKGGSSYLLMTIHRIAPFWRRREEWGVIFPILGEDSVEDVTVMREVLTVAGQTPDGEPPAVKEWCINSAAVDPGTSSILAHNEDGKLYRWDLSTNSLSQIVVLTTGLGEAYTPTAIGVDGQVYVISNATLFAVGE